jgi:glucosamine--fructose-6-phosphate aminotransferase (isomerizing)
MCGIVGYISLKENPESLKMGIQALKRLEYRGYDSAGLAFFNEEKNEIFSEKAVGRISNLEKKVKNIHQKANPLILHTRWATTGKVSRENAHPHYGCKKNIWLVHNGIIENYQNLREKLIKKGHKFYSETDTEVIANLIEEFFKGNLEEAVKLALPYLKGTYGLAVISKEDPNKIVVAKMSSPLLIGIGGGEYIVASDPTAVIARTKKVIYLEDGEVAVITPETFIITKGDELREKEAKEIDWNIEDVQKGKYKHFMLKEIMEQPESLRNALKGRIIRKEGNFCFGGLINIEKKLKDVKRLIITACGTASYAGIIGQYLMENIAGIPSSVYVASELKYKNPIFDKNTALIAISQSGETADTLGAIKEAKRKGALTIGIVNTVGSSIARETDAGIYNHAGPEIGVASTKAFTSQLLILCLLSLFLGRQRNLSQETAKEITEELLKIPDSVSKILQNHPEIRELAEKYKDYKNFLYFGRKYNYPIALEGALKLKEISYIHAEGYPAGEMKHGPIALIDENFPTFAIAPSDSVYNKMISSIEEIRVRKGPILAIATEGNKDIKNKVDNVFYIPKTLEILNPILSVVPLQLFAYYVAYLKGKDIDKPRNLAKSVTVE